MSTVTNTRGLIATLLPANTNEAQLYVVPSGTEIDGLLRICNQDTLESTFSVAHCAAGHGDIAANTREFLFYGAQLLPNTTAEVSIHAKESETIRIKSGTANKISFHLSGNVKVTS